MKRTLLSYVLIPLSMTFIGCAGKPCREPQSPLAATEVQETASSPTVWVAKSDGSTQCEGGGVTPEKMESQFKGVKVLARKQANDGLMRTTVCGASTGRFNIFEIDRKDLKQAESAGFREWKY